MKRHSRIVVFIIHCLVLASPTSFATWKPLEPGIEYQDLAPKLLHEWSHLHAFKIDPKRYTLKLIQQAQTEKTFPSIIQYATSDQGKLTFNGGFFDDKLHPLGLRISNFQTLNLMKPISWWGVFYLQHQTAKIQAAKAFHPRKDIEFAVQSGPRLLIAGRSPRLHPGFAERTALCILPNHEIVVVITQYFPLSLQQLADVLKSPSLGCQDALNLDGGSSTQFLARFSGFYRHMPGLASVADAITVIQR